VSHSAHTYVHNLLGPTWNSICLWRNIDLVNRRRCSDRQSSPVSVNELQPVHPLCLNLKRSQNIDALLQRVWLKKKLSLARGKKNEIFKPQTTMLKNFVYKRISPLSEVCVCRLHRFCLKNIFAACHLLFCRKIFNLR